MSLSKFDEQNQKRRLIYFDATIYPYHPTHKVKTWLTEQQMIQLVKQFNNNRDFYIRVIGDSHTTVLGDSKKRKPIGQIYALNFGRTTGLVGHGVLFAFDISDAEIIGKVKSGRYNRVSLGYYFPSNKPNVTPIVDHLLVSDNAFFQVEPTAQSQRTEITSKEEKSISKFANQIISTNSTIKFKLNKLVLFSLLFNQRDSFKMTDTSMPQFDSFEVDPDNITGAESAVTEMKQALKDPQTDEESRQMMSSFIQVMEEKIESVKSLKKVSEVDEKLKEIAMQAGIELEELTKAAKEFKVDAAAIPVLQVFSLQAQLQRKKHSEELAKLQKEKEVLEDNNKTLQVEMTKKRKQMEMFEKATSFMSSKRQKTAETDNEMNKVSKEAETKSQEITTAKNNTSAEEVLPHATKPKFTSQEDFFNFWNSHTRKPVATKL